MAGKTFYEWQDIACIAIDEGKIPIFRHILQLYKPDSSGDIELISKLRISRSEASTIRRWLEYLTPVFIPFRIGLLFSNIYYMHAYVWTVTGALNAHAEAGKDYVMPTRKLAPQKGESRRGWLRNILGLEILGAYMGLGALLQDQPESATVTIIDILSGLAFGAAIFPFVLIVALVIVFTPIFAIQWLLSKLRNWIQDIWRESRQKG